MCEVRKYYSIGIQDDYVGDDDVDAFSLCKLEKKFTVICRHQSFSRDGWLHCDTADSLTDSFWLVIDIFECC